MGIRCYCPNGHKLNIKSRQAGLKAICPRCGAKFQVPVHSVRKSSKKDQPETTVEAASTNDQSTTPVPPVDSEEPTAREAETIFPEVATEPLAPDNAAVGDSDEAETTAPEAIPPLPDATPTQDDLLREAPQAVWYVRPPDGGQFGPAAAEVMQGWLDEGRVGPDSLVWREGWRDWREATNVFPRFGAGEAEGDVIAAEPLSVTGERALRQRMASRRRSNTASMGIIAGLIVAVIVLAVVFVLVLLREPAEGDAKATSSLRIRERSASTGRAITAIDVDHRTRPHVVDFLARQNETQ